MTTVKVKVGGGSLADDADRVAAVRAALGPAGRIRLDANGAWDVDTAVVAIDRLAGFDLELVEQPVADLADLARVRRRVAVPVAADESLRSLGDARRLAALERRRRRGREGAAPRRRAGGAAGRRGGRRPGDRVVALRDVRSASPPASPWPPPCPSCPTPAGSGPASSSPATSWPIRWFPSAGCCAVRRPEPDPALLARWEIEP